MNEDGMEEQEAEKNGNNDKTNSRSPPRKSVCIVGCAPLCFNQNSKCRKVLLKLYNMALNETWFILVMYGFWRTVHDVATVSMFVLFL